ncbi:putative tetratricopeptide-like helical domain superfamily, DYW domain-containing protein [Helianthus annuus]|nr:putative tetratricopeptide-like helical domain superfamily, DYW domain-containing protein [Helianthus annuus]
MNSTVLQPTTTTHASHPSTFFPDFKHCKTKQHLTQLHAKLIKTGRIRDPLAAAELIRFCALSNPPHQDLQYALQVFDQMPQPNCFSFNTLIRAFSDSNDPLQSLFLFTHMTQYDDVLVKPNKYTFPSVLKACAKLGCLKQGKQVHGLLLKYGLDNDGFVLSNLVRMYVMCGAFNDAVVAFDLSKMSDVMGEVVLWNVMVDGYVRVGDVGNARKMFDEMPQRSVVSWNSMISGYAQHGLFVEALELFREMQRECSVAPNYVTLVSVLPAVSRLGALEIGRWVHFYAGRNGVKVDSVLGSALIDMYSKCGSIDEAVQTDGLTPRIEHYGCMVDLLGRAGRLQEAEELMLKMLDEPDDVVLKALLGACKKHGNIEIGERVAKRLLEKDPEDGAPYVALSNMYASLADWDGVMDTRLMMRQNEAKKDPGCSWIEVNGAIHEFVVADESHAKTNDIYMMLDEIKEKLRLVGYKPDTSQVHLRMDDRDKESALQHHSEKIAVAFGLISTTRETTIRVVKNLRICDDCHSTIKLVSRLYRRRIVVRDRKRFHHFENGSCSCMDYW